MASAQVYNDWLAESFLLGPTCSSPPRSCPSATSRRRRRARRGRELGSKARDDPDDGAGGHALQPARSTTRWAGRDPRRRSRSRSTPAPARSHSSSGARRRGHQLREGRDCSRPTRCGYFSRRRAYSNGSPVTARVCRDRRRVVRVLLRTHGRGVRGARAVGQPQARAPPSALRRRTQCYVTLGADRAPLLTARSPASSRCCGRATTRTPKARSPSRRRSSNASSGACPRPVHAIVGGNAATPRTCEPSRREPEHDQHAQGQDGRRRRRRDAVLQARCSRCRRRRWSSRARRCIAALADAGLTVDDLDGFALYSMGFDTSLFAQWLGVPDVRFTGMLTGGGGGTAGSVGLASAAIVSGMAECVVSVMTLQQAGNRFGTSFAPRGYAGRDVQRATVARRRLLATVGTHGAGADVRGARSAPHASLRHDPRAVLRSCALPRNNAIRRPDLADAGTAPRASSTSARGMISDPLCLYDFCIECDGAVAVVTTSVERRA